ncbi:protein trichome birefringence-like 34 [Amaranthus tricolor]|uniref:protein trichome birefringence-like 34 n=1 Tax=Amaranthus tricolor TaxID=29722 RepID=UPI00258A6C0D|nr:protein trichome birefringence-like 34 [Amaranthus tricolor]
MVKSSSQVNPNNNTIILPSSSTWGIRNSFQFLTIILLTLLISLLYLSQDNGSSPSFTPSPPLKNDSSLEKCDYFNGKWVYDNGTLYPLYKENECSFMSDQLACEKFGRKDLSYQKWRWQPHHCDLPRFNATALLEKLRNKRAVFVGDSLNREQWISMLCLVDSSIPPPLKSLYINGSLFTFKAMEYNAKIEFYWAPLLVESNADDPIKHSVPVAERIVRTQAIEKHATHWTNADYIFFNSYLWWRMPVVNVLWGAFESPDGTYNTIEMLKAYEMALKTWSDWLVNHVNHSKTRIFWISMAPTHERSQEWGGADGQNCYNETEPIKRENYWGSGSDPVMMKLVEDAVQNLATKGLNIQLLNITQLSEYRKDAHLSIYRKHWEPLTQQQLSNPIGYADCCHWCLPGVPDTWNEILYAFLV